MPTEFSAEVTREAARVVAAYDPRDASHDREDLRNLTVITIDPDDARDFDDAISLTELGGGRLELGVHIADVSHLVQPAGRWTRKPASASTASTSRGWSFPCSRKCSPTESAAFRRNSSG